MATPFVHLPNWQINARFNRWCFAMLLCAYAKNLTNFTNRAVWQQMDSADTTWPLQSRILFFLNPVKSSNNNSADAVHQKYARRSICTNSAFDPSFRFLYSNAINFKILSTKSSEIKNKCKPDVNSKAGADEGDFPTLVRNLPFAISRFTGKQTFYERVLKH